MAKFYVFGVVETTESTPFELTYINIMSITNGVSTMTGKSPFRGLDLRHLLNFSKGWGRLCAQPGRGQRADDARAFQGRLRRHAADQ